MHVYEVSSRKDHRRVDLISDAPPFGGYGTRANAIGCAKHRSRAPDAVNRVYDERGNLLETREHAGQI